jgi:hypothetical protein
MRRRRKKSFNDVEEQKKDAASKKTFSDSMPLSSGDLNLFFVLGLHYPRSFNPTPIGSKGLSRE